MCKRTKEQVIKDTELQDVRGVNVLHERQLIGLFSKGSKKTSYYKSINVCNPCLQISSNFNMGIHLLSEPEKWIKGDSKSLDRSPK
jgi:hypothetical protein